jgi:stage II sporulation protein R
VTSFRKKHLAVFISGLSFFVLMGILWMANDLYTSARNMERTLLRLHVMANSDSKEDQDFKLLVRDHVIHYVSENFSGHQTKEDMMEDIKENLHALQKYVEALVVMHHKYDNVAVELTNMVFPTVEYGLYTVPTGRYDGLRIILGKGTGKNWWCVLFPPLCIGNTQTVHEQKKAWEEMSIDKGVSEENFSFLRTLDNSQGVKFKFRLIEFFQESRMKAR